MGKRKRLPYITQALEFRKHPPKCDWPTYAWVAGFCSWAEAADGRPICRGRCAAWECRGLPGSVRPPVSPRERGDVDSAGGEFIGTRGTQKREERFRLRLSEGDDAMGLLETAPRGWKLPRLEPDQTGEGLEDELNLRSGVGGGVLIRTLLDRAKICGDQFCLREEHKRRWKGNFGVTRLVGAERLAAPARVSA